MLGLVVCGGKSTRMGNDKGLLARDNKTWAQIAKEKVGTLGFPVVLSINAEQAEKYRLVFRIEELIVDSSELEIAGPLLGILSTHIRFPEEDMLVLACDMPNLQPIVFEDLLGKYKTHRHFEVVAFLNDNQVEPLCAIYTARGLAKILLMYENKNLHRYSLKHVLETLHTNFIAVKESWSPYFRNFNSREDFLSA